MKNLNIKVVTQLTGINENTLRAWERRYNLIEPVRSPDGHRLYSKRDVEKLTLIARLLDQGHIIGNLASLNLSQLNKLTADERTTLQNIRPDDAQEPTPELKHLNAIIEALKQFDLAGIHQSLQEAKFGLSPKAIVTKLILPLLGQVGEQFLENKISISQEHLLSAMLRDYLGNLYQSLSPYDYRSRPGQDRFLLTTREGDLHEFGILLAAIICRVNGKETYYLGPNMPVHDLADACRQFKIDAIVLGLAPLPKESEVVTIADFIADLDRLTPKRIQFLYGGPKSSEATNLSTGRKMIGFSSIDELDRYLAGT